MTYPVFPFAGPIPGYTYSLHRRPTFSTIVQTAPSGREVTRFQQPLPLWEFELSFDELRDETQNAVPDPEFAGFTQFQQVSELFLNSAAQFSRFYFEDISDNSRSGQILGTGDGTTKTFPFLRAWGSGTLALIEQVPINTSKAYTIYIDGVAQPSGWTISADFFFITFASAPGDGLTVSADFFFYYLCRFIEDSLDFEEFFYNRWAIKTLKFRSVAPPTS